MPQPIDPRIHPDLVPEGSAPRLMGKDQQDTYLVLPAIRTPKGCVITRWEPTDAERRAVADGADIFVAIHTYNTPQQPIQVVIGASDTINWQDN